MDIADTPTKIKLYRLLVLKGRLRLELDGIKFKGQSTYALVKKEFGFKGTRQKVYEQLLQHIEKEKKNA